MFNKIACLMILPTMVFTGCMSGIAYEEKTGFGGDTPLAGHALPIRVMPMPLSLRYNDNETDESLRSKASDKVYLYGILRLLNAELDRHPEIFDRVPMPAGEEADAVMGRIIAMESGLLPPDELASVKGFKLPERFLYGSITIAVQSMPRLMGAPDISYTANLVLRLVDSNDLTYIPASGIGRASALDGAIDQAVREAVANLCGQ